MKIDKNGFSAINRISLYNLKSPREITNRNYTIYKYLKRIRQRLIYASPR
jgi:hypothetical protein